jgi:MarR family transcriptional regulator, organic hydroperoxide resistance regulator
MQLIEATSGASTKRHDIVRRFAREIASLNAQLDQIQQFWAKVVGISAPQLTILMAVEDMATENGVSVNAVSKTIHVDSPFVTTQSKLLEKQGFLHRKPSTSDGRVVLMSLTEKANDELAALAPRQESLSEFAFEGVSDHELIELIAKLAGLKRRLEKACVRAALDM